MNEKESKESEGTKLHEWDVCYTEYVLFSTRQNVLRLISMPI